MPSYTTAHKFLFLFITLPKFYSIAITPDFRNTNARELKLINFQKNPLNLFTLYDSQNDITKKKEDLPNVHQTK